MVLFFTKVSDIKKQNTNHANILVQCYPIFKLFCILIPIEFILTFILNVTKLTHQHHNSIAQTMGSEDNGAQCN